MSQLKNLWTDQDVDDIIGNILRVGVILSAVVVLLGGIFYLGRHRFDLPDYRVFRGEPTDLCNLSGILKEALAFRPRGIIQFGLVLLIATPIVRVAFTVVAFSLRRDMTYVLVTLIVFGTLLFSLTILGH